MFHPRFAAASVGSSTAAYAVLWESDGSVHDLGGLGGALNSARSINNEGEVVGAAQSPKDGTIHDSCGPGRPASWITALFLALLRP
jgi:uncharacterized membrane protein